MTMPAPGPLAQEAALLAAAVRDLLLTNPAAQAHATHTGGHATHTEGNATHASGHIGHAGGHTGHTGHTDGHAGHSGYATHTGYTGHNGRPGDDTHVGNNDHIGHAGAAGPGWTGSGRRAAAPPGGAGDAGGGAGCDCGLRPEGHHNARPDAAAMTMCQVCPLCRVVNTLAAGRPEVAGHLFAAATALAAAVRAVLAGRPDAGTDSAATAGTGPVEDTAVRGWPTERPGPGPRVQRIDVE
ncbi:MULTISPECIES: hypothetical protein [unclassified Frankia]|uniref:hypothetical protein n=1 Tax=unclassified Frankia TaxID=2632575 RepID=UPI002024C1A2